MIKSLKKLKGIRAQQLLGTLQLLDKARKSHVENEGLVAQGHWGAQTSAKVLLERFQHAEAEATRIFALFGMKNEDAAWVAVGRCVHCHRNATTKPFPV